jgi:hypothetical protein
VVFAPPYDDNDLPIDPVTGFEDSGRVVCGRNATDEERKTFKETGTMPVPYAVARKSHFEVCERIDRWLAGEATLPESDMLPGS